jgi:hypothetical protein
MDRSGSLWSAFNLRLPATAFLPDLSIGQEQTAVYRYGLQQRKTL